MGVDREQERAGRRSRPSGPVAWPLGLLGEPFYRGVINARNRRFDAGRGIVRFDRPVISVGNLSVGGTGKTPMVARVVRWLLEAGHHPVIAMRGYASAGGESDEASIYRREFPQTPIVARANRIMGLIQHFGREYQAEAAALDERDDVEAPVLEVAEDEDVEAYLQEAGLRQSDCIVLDDGFQHRQIARDLDIVLIDATRDPFADRLLPAGWLREPVSSLKRADVVVLTHAESVAAADITTLDRAAGRVRNRGLDAISRHDWTGLVVLEGSAEHEQAAAWLAGRRILAVCAIGNPEAFLEQARRATGVPLAGEVVLSDHDPYAEATIRRILEAALAAGTQAIVTTEKDWSKLSRVRPEAWPCPVARVQLAIGFDRGEEVVRGRVLSTVAAGAPE